VAAGLDAVTDVRSDADRHQQHLVRQLRDLGYAVTLRKVA
jgi:hypothetical protein